MEELIMTTMLKCLAVSIIIFLFTTADSWAFRCGSGLISTGDSQAQVLLTCGKPTIKEKSCENQQTNKISTNSKKSKKCNKVEKWYYNCGQGDFIYVLVFENKILTKEITGGRGKGSSNCRGK
jgi:Protein of unknown function (DUF2845)